MKYTSLSHWSIFACWLGLALASGAAAVRAADDVAALEEMAIRSAVDHVAPSVVRIETVGGLERVGKLLVGTGPTTGLIVSEDGLIISSAFNFVQQPSSILVTLPDGNRRPAEVVSTDHSRMLVLLRVETDQKLPTPEAVPESEMRVGQTTVAVGRTYEGDRPNVSVGIVSALDRIFGKVIQTDAKISPSNYGGPLVDIRGRVLGVLVPMSPDGDDNIAGVEWYDSGIGFAVPLETIQKKLAQMRSGSDLYRGILGVGLKRGNPYGTPPEISAAGPNSPAFKAGFKAGDTIVEIEGQPVKTQMQLRIRMGSRYAGEKVRLAAIRGSERIELDVELIDKLPPFEHGFLGLLPLRVAGEQPNGIAIRYVYPDSPAAKAGIKIGDRLISVAGKPVTTIAVAREILGPVASREEIPLEVQRGSEIIRLTLVTAALPTSIPDSLPPARGPAAKAEGQGAANVPVGISELKLPEFKNACRLYVPEKYAADVAHGIIIWLHAPGAEKDEDLVARWKPFCDANDLILVAPRASDPQRWQRTELEFVRKLLDRVIDLYTIDPARVVAHGYQSGGAMAYLLAFDNREQIHGVASIDAPLPGAGDVPSSDSVDRLAIYTTKAAKARFAQRIERGVQELQAAKYPVTVKDLGEEPRYLNAEELAELVRWIDTLDRI